MEHNVVNIRPLCLCLRLAPVGILVAVHCSNGRWPTNNECMRRASEYGFSVHNFSNKWHCLWTHMFVHLSNEHLFANSCALIYTLLEFGNASAIEALEEMSLWTSLKSATGSLLVMLVAGPVGGVGGQLLYNKVLVERPFEKVAQFLKKEIALLCRLFDTRKIQSTASHSPALETLGGIYESMSHTISNSLERVGSFWNRCFLSGAAEIQKIVNRSTVMCGASAAVCALAGFNAVFFHNPFSMIFIVLPDAVMVLQNVLNSAFASGWEKHMDSWRRLMPRQTVGHAAHLGGFAVGASVGWALRHILKRNSQTSRRPKTS